MLDLAQLHGPLVVTVAYFLLWCGFLLGLQTRTKDRLKARYEKEGKVFDRYFGQDEEMLAVDRAVANTHEQMGPFLVSLWLLAIFASPTYATWLGAAYVVLRGAYPLLIGKRVSKVQSGLEFARSTATASRCTLGARCSIGVKSAARRRSR